MIVFLEGKINPKVERGEDVTDAQYPYLFMNSTKASITTG